MLFLRNTIVFLVLCLIHDAFCQRITEFEYQGRPHFNVETKSATYLYDRLGGGFSSMIDRDGIEWIGFKPGKGQVPESAAADFRGLPNLVFRGKDNGAGHPGFNQCVSKKIGKKKIRTESSSGLWVWEWTFNQGEAELEIIKVDMTRNYWFLYEGIPGGSYKPVNKYWGNNLDGIRYDAPPLKADSIAIGNWDWVFFGDKDLSRTLVIRHMTPDQLEDNFSYMGSSKDGINAEDGMVVFGFGRSGSTPLMNKPNRFRMGLLETQGDIVQQVKSYFEQ